MSLQVDQPRSDCSMHIKLNYIVMIMRLVHVIISLFEEEETQYFPYTFVQSNLY